MMSSLFGGPASSQPTRRALTPANTSTPGLDWDWCVSDEPVSITDVDSVFSRSLAADSGIESLVYSLGWYDTNMNKKYPAVKIGPWGLRCYWYHATLFASLFQVVTSIFTPNTALLFLIVVRPWYLKSSDLILIYIFNSRSHLHLFHIAMALACCEISNADARKGCPALYCTSARWRTSTTFPTQAIFNSLWTYIDDQHMQLATPNRALPHEMIGQTTIPGTSSYFH